MNRLDTASACIEWVARLALSGLCAAAGIALAVAATMTATGGQPILAVLLAAGALVAGLVAAALARRAIRRIRGGPDSPPGESF